MKTYRIEGMTLVEQPHWDKPNEMHYNFGADEGKLAAFNFGRYHSDMLAYEEHLKKLQRVAISPELKEWLGDRQTVTSEEIEIVSIEAEGVEIIELAYPAKPKQSDGDEVWSVALKEAYEYAKENEGFVIWRFRELIEEYLKSNYKIAKR